MSKLDIQTFHFRCGNGDMVSVPATDEAAARSIAMERRWGPPMFNKTWVCDKWFGLGLLLVGEDGLPIVEARS